MAVWLAAILLVPVPATETLPDEVVVERLISALKDPDLDVRLHLGASLAKLPTAAIGPLTRALSDTNPARRAGAAYALGLLGTPARTALPELLNSLDDPELEVRRQAAQAVSRVLPTTNPERPRPQPIRVRR